MTSALEFALVGMKASLDQLERTGEQMVQLITETNVTQNTVALVTEHRTYEANAVVAHTADQVLGTLLDTFV